MDQHQQQQTQQTEKMIMKMLDFLEADSEDENGLDQLTMQEKQAEKIVMKMLDFLETSLADENKLGQLPVKEKHKKMETVKVDIVIENIKNQTTETEKLFKVDKKELQKVNELDNQQQHEENGAKVVSNNNNSNSNIEIQSNYSASADLAHLDEQYKLENHCRYSCNNSFAQEVFRAIYLDTTNHPAVGSADYYRAAQNYVLYGKDFLDFPDNIQLLFNDKNYQNSVCEGSNFIANFGNSTYFKPPATATLMSGGLATTAATYYHIYNGLQTQARPSLAPSTVNCNQSYGLFLGNQLTYVGRSQPTPTSLMYNLHNTTTTNFISNTLANTALATSPAILYTNPMLTTSQQYLTQFLSASANSMQSSTVAGKAYEHLTYAQMLQQQLYHTQRAATISSNFLRKQRIAALRSNKIMTNRPIP